MQRRLPNLPREEWTEEARDVFAFWGEPNAREEGSRTNIMMVLAHHPAMAIPFNNWAKHLLMTNTLDTRALELLILRVAWRLQSAYEWHNHVRYGMNAGLTLEEIALVREFSETAEEWQERDRAVLQAVDDLLDHNRVSDATWEMLGRHFDKRQKMDMVMAIGHYVMTSWAIASFDIPLEDDLDPIGFDLKTASGKTPGKAYKPGETEDWAQQFENE